MKLRIFLLFLVFVSLSSFAQGEVFEYTSTSGVSQNIDEMDSFLSMLKFIEDFRTIMSEIRDVRELVQESYDETIELLDLFSQINTSSICNSCQSLVGDFRRHDDVKRLEQIFETVAEAVCSEHLNKSVCIGAVTSFGEILLNALYNKILSPYNICERFFMCPKTSHRETIKEYVKDVLKDKPANDIPTPKKNSTYTIMHVTDPHIDLEYEAGTNAVCDQPLCCRAVYGEATNGSQAAQYWGTFAACDIPLRTFDQFLQFVANNFDVDMIFWTGDNIAHDIWQQNKENQTVNTYDATQELMKYFPDTDIYPMFGNHEPWPADEFDFTGNGSDWLKSSLSEMWQGWLDEEALENFREKSYYAMVNAEHNIKIIALNSIACDSNDFYLITDPTDPLGQLEWMRQELYESESSNQAVFIIGHIPPGDFGCDSAWSARYRALIDRFTNIIRGQFFGHTHDDQFQVVRSYADSSPVGAVYIAPSLTTYSDHYPSFRIFEIDSETNTPINYYQYMLDLDKWNQNTTGPIQWDLAYSFTEEYNLEDMSFKSFDQLADRIKHDNGTLQRYLYNYHSAGGPDPVNLTKRQLQHYYCGAKHSVSEEAFKCLGLDVSVQDLLSLAQQMLPGRWHVSHC